MTAEAEHSKKRSRIRIYIARAIGLTAWTIFLIVATLLALEAMRVKGMPALEPWHETEPPSEFTADVVDEDFDFNDYLAREDAVFKELNDYLVDPANRRGMSEIIRYVRGGIGDPSTFETNWNRTQILEPEGEPVGGALLLHGLTDSPYSMRSMAEFLRAQGYLCICLRYPGHGTVPAGILKAKAEDWIAAARLAWRELRSRVPGGKPLLFCGYSTGGAIAVLLTLEAIASGERTADRLILFSPAVGITPFAAASNLHKLYSWIPFYCKAKWLSIEPEYDPFKYNSFPQAAGAQSWALTGKVEAALAAAAANGNISKMPPVLTFQSLVDSTVVARDILTRLYDRLPMNGSEVVVFDVNRGAQLDGLLSQSVPDVEPRLANPTRTFDITLISNVDPKSRSMVARHSEARSAQVITQAIDAAWPRQVYSLAHVAIPFPPDDVIYGDGSAEASAQRLNIGHLSMRGERGVLRISANDLMRLRHNPFHAYMMARIGKTLASPPAAP